MPGDRVVYVPSRSGIAAYGLSLELRAAVMAVAGEVKAAAVANSPVKSGAYVNAFHVVPSEMVVGGVSRVSALVVNSSPYAHGVEWRNGQRPLGSAAQAFGGKKYGSVSGRGSASPRRSGGSRPRRSVGSRRRASQGG